MPELPDITIYLEALEKRVLGQPVQRVRILNPFVLRTFEPPIESVCGKPVRSLSRIGKRIVLGFDGELWLVIHLMIAGRLHWKIPPVKLGSRVNLAALEFEAGTLLFTEAGAKRRASIQLISGSEVLQKLDPGGIDVMTATLDQFRATLIRENHTLKRALTDPRLFSGIGNAYSDEILHRARLSPLVLTTKLDAESHARLWTATRAVLQEWIERLRAQAGGEFPEKVTAFRPEMAVHGRFGMPCPECKCAVQRIRYADNETNYCPNCQTNGRLLADRSLSRLLKDDWPRRLEE